MSSGRTNWSSRRTKNRQNALLKDSVALLHDSLALLHGIVALPDGIVALLHDIVVLLDDIVVLLRDIVLLLDDIVVLLRDTLALPDGIVKRFGDRQNYLVEYVDDKSRQKYEKDYTHKETGITVHPIFIETGN
ncbi:MAG: hypothetical protein GY940_00815 [bacterium]|nr:hypothetical protein [bacterium]